MQIPSADQTRPDQKLYPLAPRILRSMPLVSLKVINQLIKRNRKDNGWDCISLEIPSNNLVTQTDHWEKWFSRGSGLKLFD